MINDRPTHWLRLCLGVAFLTGGGALLFATISKHRPNEAEGLSLLTLLSAAIGLAALGAGVDAICGRAPAADAPKIRNTEIYGAASPAPELEATSAASGRVQTPMGDQAFPD